MYRSKLNEKLQESLAAVLPILAIVLILSFTIAPLPTSVLMAFLFGAVLLIYGVFNAVFLPAFYKTAVRVGRSFLLAVVPMTVLMVLVEALSHFPVVGPYLDAADAAGQVRQLPVLAAGAAAFALLSWLAFRRAAKNYERVDL